MIGRRLRAGAATGAIVALVGICGPVAAAEWTVNTVLDFGAIRDDNIRLTLDPHDTTSGYIAATSIEAERRTETSTATIDASVAHSAYDSSDVNDKTDQRLRLDAEKQTSERGTLGLEGRYRRDTLFETVVVEQDGVGDVRDVDVGLSTIAEVRRNYWLASPSWTWLLTERSSIRLAYRWRDVSFSDNVTGSLFDYTEDRISADYTRQLNPRDDLTVAVNAFEYRPDRPDTEAETVQLLAGVKRRFSETLRGSVSFGGSRTTERVSGVEEDANGTVVRATLDQRGELSRLQGVISRDVTPSGIGRALRTDQLRVHWVRDISPMVQLVLRARYLRNRAIEGGGSGINRRYYEISPQLRWRWLENVSIVGSYRYREQKFDANPDSADSSAVFLGLSYRL